MFELDPWSERRRRIAMRPDAHLAMRADAYRFMPRQPPRWATKEEVRLFWAPSGVDVTSYELRDRARQKAIAADFDKLLRLRRKLAELKCLVNVQRRLREAKTYNPDQPRVPAGSREGGQWTGEGSQGRPTRLAGPPPRPPQRSSRADGHHYVPRGVYEKLPLPPETRKVFEEAKTGRLYDLRSNKYDTPHREYNDAVAKLFDGFVERNGIQIDRMTPDQARDFVNEVLASQEPSIRNYNMLIQMREIMQRVFRRFGRPE